MKKIAIFLACFAATLTLQAQPQRAEFDKLPANSQTFVRTYMGNQQIDYVTLNRDATWNKYTVHFANGNQMSFEGGSGDCTQVIMKEGTIPAALIPTKIQSYLSSHHYTDGVTMLERTEEGGCKLRLANGKVLQFDSNGVCHEKDGRECSPHKTDKNHGETRH